ncbi:MAG: hypothetical protein F4W95_09455 [Chloroflexi bacterium]|nr:hypothetical protein [Chloroflexota bacterium]MYD48695.1 hypothetical protein [Chloroflexota bacterium]
MERVNMKLVVMTQRRPDKWACRLPAFGCTVYGATFEEAKANSRDAVSTLLRSFTTREEVESFLQSREVDYTISVVEEAEWSEESNEAMEVSLAIAS